MNLGITGRIARTAAARPWVTIGVWVLVLALSIFAAGGLGSALSQDGELQVSTESKVAETDAQALRGGGDEPRVETIVVALEAPQPGAAYSSLVGDVTRQLAAVEGVEQVLPPNAQTTAPDGSSALIRIVIAADAPEEVGAQILAVLRATDTAEFDLLPLGEASAGAIFDEIAEDTLVRGEVIGISIALVILVVVFGALVAAGLPLLVAIVSITVAIGTTAVVGQAYELSFFVVNMITMMGLALGIDYSLVAVQRFREELAHGRTVIDAVSVAGNTANRAVFFSGVTVVLALLGLLLVPSTIMRSLGAGAILVAIASVATALTLLPAVLKLLGHRVNKGRIPTAHPGRESRTWTAIARRVIARPSVGIITGAVILTALALPMTQMRLAFPGLDSLPADNEVRRAATVLVDDYGLGQSNTIVTLPGAAAAPQAVEALAEQIDSLPAFTGTRVEWFDGGAIIVTEDVYDGADERAAAAIATLRTETLPDALAGTDIAASVGGDQAMSVDFTDVVAESTPWVLLFVLGTSFLLLLVIFRSLVIPAMSIVLNLASAAAAFGLMVVVFQWGWGADLLGMPQVDGIAPWIPLFLFAVLFGLSMDYHVFLLSRIKERHDAGDSTDQAIVVGLSRTGSLITGAALIMVAVFSGFALGDLAEFAQMGFGLAAAIIIDATLVRSILVPSIMAALGDANWYLPRWLQWLPQMRIEAPDEPVAEPEPEPDDYREFVDA